jgi:hypothetical protein
MTEKPPWRDAIEQFERSIGAPIEEYVKSDEFADRAAQSAKGQAQMQRDMTASTTQLLHTMNLPAATDIAELRAEVAELRAEVRVLTDALIPKAAKPEPEPEPGPEPEPEPEPKPESESE